MDTAKLSTCSTKALFARSSGEAGAHGDLGVSTLSSRLHGQGGEAQDGAPLLPASIPRIKLRTGGVQQKAKMKKAMHVMICCGKRPS